MRSAKLPLVVFLLAAGMVLLPGKSVADDKPDFGRWEKECKPSFTNSSFCGFPSSPNMGFTTSR